MRYNSVASNISFASNTVLGTNIRGIGNISKDGYICPTKAATLSDFNVRINGADCGANNSVTLNPWIDSDAGTSYSSTSQIDMHLQGSTYL